MNIITSIDKNCDKKVLDVTATDCEGFTINEWMDAKEAEEYLKSLLSSVVVTEAFLNYQGKD